MERPTINIWNIIGDNFYKSSSIRGNYHVWWLSLMILFTGCRSSYEFSFESLEGPYYDGNYTKKFPPSNNLNSIKVISYNIEFANNFEEAIELLNSELLKDFDIMLLQEMDEIATDAISKALNCAYIYYPAIDHPGQGKLVGNAILSRWPIISHYKLKLPHPSAYPIVKEVLLKGKMHKFRKLGTVAIIEVNGREIACYSVHGAAINSSKARRAIAQTIADDIVNRQHPHVIVGGDFNTVGYGDIMATVDPFEKAGMLWASRDIGRTIGHIRWIVSFFNKEAFQADHFFVKGMEVQTNGKVENTEISDHFPIWMKLK